MSEVLCLKQVLFSSRANLHSKSFGLSTFAYWQSVLCSTYFERQCNLIAINFRVWRYVLQIFTMKYAMMNWLKAGSLHSRTQNHKRTCIGIVNQGNLTISRPPPEGRSPGSFFSKNLQWPRRSSNLKKVHEICTYCDLYLIAVSRGFCTNFHFLRMPWPLLTNMAIRVVEFSNGGYKIGKIFA